MIIMTMATNTTIMMMSANATPITTRKSTNTYTEAAVHAAIMTTTKRKS